SLVETLTMTSLTRLGAVRIAVMSVIFKGGRPRGVDSGWGWAAAAEGVARAMRSMPPAAAPADIQPRTSRRLMVISAPCRRTPEVGEVLHNPPRLIAAGGGQSNPWAGTPQPAGRGAARDCGAGPGWAPGARPSGVGPRAHDRIGEKEALHDA